jgi:ATP-dependent DNA helicase RecG
MELKDIQGIGKVTLEKLKDIGIASLEEMLFCFPKKYEIFRLHSHEDLQIDKNLTLKINVIDRPKLVYIRKKLTKLTIQVSLDNLKFTVSIFNREFLKNQINSGDQIVVTGKFLKNYNSFSASNLVLYKNFVEGIFPVYGLNGILDSRIRKIINNILKSEYLLNEELPEFIIKKNKFDNINLTIKKIHIPKSLEDVDQAKYRLAYEEFLKFGARIELISNLNMRVTRPLKHYDISQVKQLISTLPFELTDDQKAVTNEIFLDFKKKNRMNRLLQGDVGSGKTIVAILCAYAVVTAGYQVAILAPTLVLAKQHYYSFVNILRDSSLKIELLTSETPNFERMRILTETKNHLVDIIIGTHSLLQDDITFKNLGFVVIDEQQRFGVEQRKAIREKGVNPDILMMTATPIPRTLAISLFENTEVSTIRQKPRNRKHIKTEIVDFQGLTKPFKIIEKELEKHRQIYVICPLIETSDTRNYFALEDAFSLIKERFKSAKINILHGKMSDLEKTSVLDQFYTGQTDILISTTVVEVGVNIENASAMIIFNANAFGLAQIHQLRGRIGRNDFDAYCYLVVDDFIEEIERLKILEQTNDGFLISEYDLAFRGPGEVFGKAQSGVPNFRFANLIKDQEIRDLAFEDAKQLIRSNDTSSQKIVNKVLKTIDSYNLD